MANIHPFRPIMYNPEVITDYSKVLTQPYDQVNEELHNLYWNRHEYNNIKLESGVLYAGKDVDPYTRSQKLFKEWMDKKILFQFPQPAMFAYFQEHTLPNGTTKIRKGLIANYELENFADGNIFPHERTFDAPRVDRRKMMEAMGATTGQLFLLYSDPEKTVNETLNDIVSQKPMIRCVDDLGVLHLLWPVTDETKIKTIQSVLDKSKIFIADGHHRYEAALEYRDIMRSKGRHCKGTETFERVMATFVNYTDTESLTIFPTHRIIEPNAGFSYSVFKQDLGKYFDMAAYNFGNDAGKQSMLEEMEEDLRFEGKGKNCLGVYCRNEREFLLLTLKNPALAIPWMLDLKLDVQKKLDVNVLHRIVLENVLGLSRDKLSNHEQIDYVRGAAKAVERVDKGDAKLAFILNATKMQQVVDVSTGGQRMPQKSTDFFPKLLSGLAIHRFEFA